MQIDFTNKQQPILFETETFIVHSNDAASNNNSSTADELANQTVPTHRQIISLNCSNE